MDSMRLSSSVRALCGLICDVAPISGYDDGKGDAWGQIRSRKEDREASHLSES